MRVSNALNAIGEKLRYLSFLPHENLHNIVTFQEVICRSLARISYLTPLTDPAQVVLCQQEEAAQHQVLHLRVSL